MSDFIIATSSTCDLPRTWLDEHNVPFISYSFTINDQPAVDDCREESRAQIYAGMRKGDILKTSQINEPAYEEFFRKLLSDGKDVLFLDMSEKMFAERLQLAPARAGDGAAPAAVVDQGVHGLLEHALLIAHDDEIGRAHV